MPTTDDTAIFVRPPSPRLVPLVLPNWQDPPEHHELPPIPPLDVSWLKAEHGWDSFSNEVLFPLSSEPKTDPWQTCVSLISKYDKEMCDSWREEVNMLLLFASLFSAIVTAFQVEASKDLREDSEAASIALLSQILARLNHDPSSGPFIPTPPPSFKPSSLSIQVNILWSTSLALSLLAVTLGILCLQWFREYQRAQPGLSHQQLLSMRQMKYDGLMYWRIPWIVASLPILFVISLLLFLVGLVQNMWQTAVLQAAIPLTILVCLVGLMILASTALPGLVDIASSEHGFGGSKSNKPPTPYCVFRSPQSAGFGRVLAHTALKICTIYAKLRKPGAVRCIFNLGSLAEASGRAERERWQLDYIQAIHRDGVSALSWFSRTFDYSQESAILLYKCVHDVGNPQLAWDIVWGIARSEDGEFVLPPGGGGSSLGVTTMVQDIARLRLVQYLFGESAGLYNRYVRARRVPVPDALHIHWLELFLRVRWGLLTWRGQVEEVQPYTKTITSGEMACPPISNYVNPRRQVFPCIPDSVRTQLLRHFMYRVMEGMIDIEDCIELLSLLTTVILNPLTPLANADHKEHNIRFLDTGFHILLVYMDIEARRYSRPIDDEAEIMIQWFCRGCLVPWTTRYNRAAFLKNMHLLDGSKIFAAFMEVVEKGLGSLRKVTDRGEGADSLLAWERFYVLQTRGGRRNSM